MTIQSSNSCPAGFVRIQAEKQTKQGLETQEKDADTAPQIHQVVKLVPFSIVG
jgi:hypothetical protein